MFVHVSWYDQWPNRVSYVLVQFKGAQGTSVHPLTLAAHTSTALPLVLIALGITLVVGFGSLLPTLCLCGSVFDGRCFLG